MVGHITLSKETLLHFYDHAGGNRNTDHKVVFFFFENTEKCFFFFSKQAKMVCF